MPAMTQCHAHYATNLGRLKGLGKHIIATVVQHVCPEPFVRMPGNHHDRRRVIQATCFPKNILPVSIRQIFFAKNETGMRPQERSGFPQGACPLNGPAIVVKDTFE